MQTRKFTGYYKPLIGATQKEAVALYDSIGKSIDEIQELLHCPRASIRGRLSEIRKDMLNHD